MSSSNTPMVKSISSQESGGSPLDSIGQGCQQRSESSPAVSHARTSATQGNGLESLESVPDSGQRCTAASAWHDPITSSWRTWQLCLNPCENGEEYADQPQLEEFWETFPRSGTMRNGRLYRETTSVCLNTGEESGLLPTLVHREPKDFSRGEVLAKLDRGDGVAKRICNRSTMLRFSPEICGLNPLFAEWMMGYPEGWTGLEHAEMPSSRKRRKSSAKPSEKTSKGG